MEKFITHTGTALPLRQSGIDTDQILPSKYLKRISRTGFEDALFADWLQLRGALRESTGLIRRNSSNA